MEKQFGRRAFLKVACLTAAATVAAQAYDKKLIVNTMDMKIRDPKNPTEGELKHSPDIKVGEKDSKGFSLIEVEVGQNGIIHPSSANHWIYQIELYADNNKISVVDLEPVISRGYLSSRVDLSNVKNLTAIAKCNLHGNYTTSVNL